MHTRDEWKELWQRLRLHAYETHDLLGDRLCDPVTYHHTERCGSNEVPIKSTNRDTTNIVMEAEAGRGDSRALRITGTLDLTCQPD